jgi:ectoine hydroxylase-related dioxygenase (phytanoyl-CoA dioxygenase family)
MLSNEVAAAFEHDGVVCVRAAFDQNWIERLRLAIERRIQENKATVRPDQPGGFVSDINMWDEDADFRSFAFESSASELAGTLMGSNEIRLFKDQLFIKEPGSPDAVTPWHHDLPYWCVDGKQICSIWMPLDTVDASNGAVEYVKGSHKWDALYSPTDFSIGNSERKAGVYEPIPDIGAMRSKLDIVSFDVEPGDCIVFHARTIHGGPGNESRRWRRAYSTRWAGDDAVYYTRPTSSKPLRDPGIASGEPLRGEMFPLVWNSASPTTD